MANPNVFPQEGDTVEVVTRQWTRRTGTTGTVFRVKDNILVPQWRVVVDFPDGARIAYAENELRVIAPTDDLRK